MECGRKVVFIAGEMHDHSLYHNATCRITAAVLLLLASIMDYGHGIAGLVIWTLALHAYAYRYIRIIPVRAPF